MCAERDIETMTQSGQRNIASDDERDGLLEDFRALRQELLGVQNARLWGTLIYLAITGGVVTLQTKSNYPSLYLFLILAALPIIWHTANRERSRIRIAAYIKVVIEPCIPGLAWEAHLREWRNVAQGKTRLGNFFDRWRYILALTGVYALIVLASLVLLLLSKTGIVLKLSGVVAFALCVESLIYLNKVQGSGDTYEDIFRKASQKLRQKKEIT